MSYENSEPKTLKTLNSDGQVLDDSGNVISDSTDYWKKTYNESEPKPDKILHSDGTIKDSAGNLIQGSTEFNIKKYNQAEPIPAKYLHADGTIDENPGSGGGGGGDSGSASVYAWRLTGDDFSIYLNVDKAPDSSSDANKMKVLNTYMSGLETESLLSEDGTYTKISDTQFQILQEGSSDPDVYERYSEDDVIIWEGEGGGNTTTYAWHEYRTESFSPTEMDAGITYFDFSSVPATQSDFENGHILDDGDGLEVIKNGEYFTTINEYIVSEGEIIVKLPAGHRRFVRESASDFTIWEASGDITVEPLSVTENGTYTAPSGKAYSPVNVNVPSGGINTLYAFVHDDYVYYSTTLDLNVGDKLLSITITGYDPINDIIIASYDSSTNTATDEYGTIYQYDSTKNISLV